MPTPFDWQRKKLRNLFASIFCTAGDMCTQNERLAVDFFKSIIATWHDFSSQKTLHGGTIKPITWVRMIRKLCQEEGMVKTCRRKSATGLPNILDAQHWLSHWKKAVPNQTFPSFFHTSTQFIHLFPSLHLSLFSPYETVEMIGNNSNREYVVNGKKPGHKFWSWLARNSFSSPPPSLIPIFCSSTIFPTTKPQNII